MFEYLMPMLVMPCYENTLLDQSRCTRRWSGRSTMAASATCPGACRVGLPRDRHRAELPVPRAFGVPGLGLKRGLAEDLVVAP